MRSVLRHWGLEGAAVEPISVGLINRTFRVRAAGGAFVLQELHAVLEPSVNEDIEAVTQHLRRKDVTTPTLVRTREGALFAREGGIWRLLTHVAGETLSQVQAPEVARAAGRGLGVFHRALLDCEHTFVFVRPLAHDTPSHLRRLEAAVAGHRAHAAWREVRPVAEAILAAGAALPAVGALPVRVVHGDPKITNLLFDASHARVVALVDLDTLARGTLAVELGDALRSWCNPCAEDDPAAYVDEALYEAAVGGYLEEMGEHLHPEEPRAFRAGLETIAIELAARFCRDALEESYFAWDPARYPSRSAHNLARARAQLTLGSHAARAPSAAGGGAAAGTSSPPG